MYNITFSIFLGHFSPEALGDYLAGPNHTLPTLGTARFSSPLGVDDFRKRSSYLCYSRDALAAVSKNIQCFAEAEQLQAMKDNGMQVVENPDLDSFKAAVQPVYDAYPQYADTLAKIQAVTDAM